MGGKISPYFRISLIFEEPVKTQNWRIQFPVPFALFREELWQSHDQDMITIPHVKLGKVDGSLTLNLQELTDQEKSHVKPFLRVLPALSFKPDSEASSTVYLPFITISSTFLIVSCHIPSTGAS